MLGCYDFCAYYEWTFAWLEKRGGTELLHQYWLHGIAEDSQQHTTKLMKEKGFDGMAEYWGHTLNEESPEQGYVISRGTDFFRIDMHDCPSKGFLLMNQLEQHSDYCDHCIGWVEPVLDQAGFATDHQHNHKGQCWWEIRRKGDRSGASLPGAAVGDDVDVRLREGWEPDEGTVIDSFLRNHTKPRNQADSSAGSNCSS